MTTGLAARRVRINPILGGPNCTYAEPIQTVDKHKGVIILPSANPWGSRLETHFFLPLILIFVVFISGHSPRCRLLLHPPNDSFVWSVVWSGFGSTSASIGASKSWWCRRRRQHQCTFRLLDGRLPRHPQQRSRMIRLGRRRSCALRRACARTHSRARWRSNGSASRWKDRRPVPPAGFEPSSRCVEEH